MDSLNPIYCPNCKANLDTTAAFCLMCGRQQRRNAADPFLDPATRSGRGLIRSNSNARIAATVASAIAATIMIPIIIFCIWKHPFGCLAAIIVILLPLVVFFHRQFQRSPAILGAIACCLCLFSTQILDKFQERRAENRAERVSYATRLPDSPVGFTTAPNTGLTSPDAPAPTRTGKRRFGSGMLRQFIKSRMRRHRRSDASAPPPPGGQAANRPQFPQGIPGLGQAGDDGNE